MFSSSPPRTSSPPPADDEDVEMADVDSPVAVDSPISDFSGRASNVSLMSHPPRSPARHTFRNRPRTTIPAAPDHDMKDSSSDNINQGEIVWGTDIVFEDSKRRFYEFINDFQRDDQELYRNMISDCIESEIWSLNLDAQNLYKHDRSLYRQLVLYPQEMVPLFDLVINEWAIENFAEELEEAAAGHELPAFSTKPFNLLEIGTMRNMNPEDIDKLIAIRGMVIRATGIIPDINEAFFRCTVCHQTQTAPIDHGRVLEPTVCPNQQCQSKLSMRLEHNRCSFLDKQLLKVQETPESIPDGETPQTIDVYVFDDLVDFCKPGDRVEITGVYRARAIRMNPRRRTVESVFNVYIDSVHFRKTSVNQFSVETNQTSEDSEFFTSIDETDTAAIERQQRLERIKDLAVRTDIYELLVRSFAPSIYEMDDVKKGILCQLFGASRKDFSDIGGGKFRSQLNVLLCGDPGTSKSQLLQYVHKVAPRGIYTSGKGSSAVGLTAYVTKDPETRDIVLESGALVLSDRGICCIDEFDKMSDSARSILHEVMEQQTISVAKAGIICELNARTSILAAANPIESRYNPNKSVVENIDLPSTLMSRFDLIYLVLDNPNELLDRRLARHIVALYYAEGDRDVEDEEKEMLDTETFMEYISYCRREIHPKLTDEACTKLIEGYCEMRSIGRHAGRKLITATPRQLESLIRISEALARMRQSDTVEEDDVEEAIRLQKVATLQAATDPRTGAIDMNIITSGRSRDEEQRIQKMAEIASQVLVAHRRKTIHFDTLMDKYNKKVPESDTISWKDLKKVIEHLEKEGRVRPSNMMAENPVITIIRAD